MNLSAKRERVIDLIKTHGHQMTEQQLDKALDAWDGLVKSSLNSSLPVHHDNQDNKKEKPVGTITKAQINAADTELDRIQKALPPLRWGQTPRFIGEKVGNTTSSPEPQQTAPAAPAPTAAQQLRGSRSNTPLNGHQLAAQRCGLDPHTPGVESMTVDQMKQAAHEVNVKATAPLALKAGLQYRR